MKIIEVDNKKTQKEFLEFPKRLYKNDLNWICPLDVEIKGIFNLKTNKKFNNGAAKRWLLVNTEGKTIGRIAAFFDKSHMTHFEYPTGGCGFFECIDNQNAANLLFNKAKDWLWGKGMKAMQGPINFGENYNHWGLLVDGFVPQTYALPYNFPYYQKLFESYGFKNYFEQYSYNKDINSQWPDRMMKFSEFISTRPNYSFRHLDYSKLDEFSKYFAEIYNVIWSGFHDKYTPIETDEIRQMLLEAKTVFDEELVWFAFDEGKPIGFMGVMPDANQILAKLKNGRLNLFNKLKFLYYKKRAITRIRVFVGGAHPDYQNKGIPGALFIKVYKTAKAKNIKEIDLSWVGDYNEKMQALYKYSGAEVSKTHITYIKLFDDKIKFKRFTNEFEGKLY